MDEQKPQIIKPTVGRVVWYYPGALDGMGALDGGPMKADVVYVHNDRMVNLSIFDHVGNHYTRNSVQLVQEGDAVARGVGWCQWMPYQVGQAKKHEADEAKTG